MLRADAHAVRRAKASLRHLPLPHKILGRDLAAGNRLDLHREIEGRLALAGLQSVYPPTRDAERLAERLLRYDWVLAVSPNRECVFVFHGVRLARSQLNCNGV